MQFKISKNSLLALLLRSPWWVSICIALVLALLASFFMPENYAQYALPAAIPFTLIGMYVAWKQWKLPSRAQITATLETIAVMPWREFSSLMEHAYQREGYVVSCSNGVADFTVVKAGRTSLISCKRWKAASHGLDLLRELKALRQAQGANEAVYVTICGIQDNAQTFADDHGIVLMQGTELAQFLRLPHKKKSP